MVCMGLPILYTPAIVHQLINIFTESIEDEDEVLTALGDELGNFVEYVGGPEYAHTLLSPLENLAAIEEPIVREKACYHTTSHPKT